MMKWRKAMLSSIQKMLDSFNKYNIEYCHWKSNEHLEEALRGDTDLDVLFRPDQRRKLEYALSEAGLKRFRATPLMQYNAIEDYIGYDKDAAKIWHLHLHYRLSLGEKHLKGYTVPWTEYIISRRHFVNTEEGGIYCSNPADELFLLYIRMSLKLRWRDFGRRIGKDDIAEMLWLKEQTTSGEIEKVANFLLNKNVAYEVQRVLECDLTHKKQILRLQKILRKEMRAFTPYSRFSSWALRTKRELFWLIGGVKRRMGFNSTKPNRRVSPSGGTVVAILGCDGAGKSTILSYVKKEFNKKIDVYNTYLGSGDGNSSLLRKPMKIVAKRVGGRGIGHAVEKELDSGKRSSLKSKLYSVAKIIWAVTLAQEKKNKLRKVTKARNNGMLVLIDRYPQTEVAGFSDGPLLTRYVKSNALLKRIAQWEYSIYSSAYTNGPDLLIKLMVPTEVAIQRKPEMTVEEIDNKKSAVKKIHCGKKEVEVSTDRELLESVRDVLQAIWEEM